MSTNPICATVGVDDAVRVVLAELKFFASPKMFPSKLAANLRRYGDIEVFFDLKRDGIAVFHLVTHDNIEISVEVDFAELDREYLDDIVKAVEDGINKKRGSRAPIVLQ